MCPRAIGLLRHQQYGRAVRFCDLQKRGVAYFVAVINPVGKLGAGVAFVKVVKIIEPHYNLMLIDTGPLISLYRCVADNGHGIATTSVEQKLFER